MIKEFVDKINTEKSKLEDVFKLKHPSCYKELVTNVITFLSDDKYDSIDPERVHEIDDGDYQGTLLYVIGAKGYQPSTYWSVAVSYGSCSGCDTLQAITDFGDDPPDEQQVKDYMTLALHIVQGLKLIGG